MLISVITVAKNAQSTIGDCIESVLEQEYEEIEYIFVVGDTNDITNTVIDSYKERMHQRNIRYKHISEKDTGIYNAMNKGIENAGGEWIYFLNADDKLCNRKVLSDIFNRSDLQYEDIDCIYGNIVLTKGNNSVVRKGMPIDTILYKYPFSHQAVFVKHSVIDQYRFDEKYKRLADFNSFLKMYLNNTRFLYVDTNIAFFSLQGVSQKNNIKLALERERIHKDLGVSNQKRIHRWVRYFFICLIKDNRALYKVYIIVNEQFQRLIVGCNRFIMLRRL